MFFYLYYKEFSDVGSIGSAEMLHRSNMIALVAGGQKPKYADNTGKSLTANCQKKVQKDFNFFIFIFLIKQTRTVLIWDDFKKQFISEFTFSSTVISVKFRKERYTKLIKRCFFLLKTNLVYWLYFVLFNN